MTGTELDKEESSRDGQVGQEVRVFSTPFFSSPRKAQDNAHDDKDDRMRAIDPQRPGAQHEGPEDATEHGS